MLGVVVVICFPCEVHGQKLFKRSTAVHTALESVAQSYQQRLLALQKAQKALEALDNVGDTEGIRYIVLEREACYVLLVERSVPRGELIVTLCHSH
jgi:hypothetical protein